jgi:hypothetical protein
MPTIRRPDVRPAGFEESLDRHEITASWTRATKAAAQGGFFIGFSLRYRTNH